MVYVGTAYTIYNDYKLISLVKRNKCAFFINSQLNYEAAHTISLKEKKAVSSAYELARQVFFVSKRNKLAAEKHLERSIPNGMVLRNPVNISSTEIIPYPLKDKMYFAMVGNLRIIHKGQDIVLEILSSAIWKKRNWHLNIYGSGEDEHFLKQLMHTGGLSDRVTFHGRVNDIRGIWLVNHILLMPSYLEGMPLAIVEAMLCGRLCVATDVGGIEEWIEENISGFIAEMPSLFSFAKTMEKAWSNKEEWELMGINAHERAMHLFDPHAGRTLLELILKHFG